jgi:hypothetical protein
MNAYDRIFAFLQHVITSFDSKVFMARVLGDTRGIDEGKRQGSEF